MGRSEAARRADQDSVNPCYVPRNQLMQTAIARAEAGDYDEVSPPLSRLNLNILLTCCRELLWMSRRGGSHSGAAAEAFVVSRAAQGAAESFRETI